MSCIDEADSVFEADFGSRSLRVPVKRLDADRGKVGATTSNVSEVGIRALTQNASAVVDNGRDTTSLDSSGEALLEVDSEHLVRAGPRDEAGVGRIQRVSEQAGGRWSLGPGHRVHVRDHPG